MQIERECYNKHPVPSSTVVPHSFAPLQDIAAMLLLAPATAIFICFIYGILTHILHHDSHIPVHE